jgi:nucleotide-binding universal stress UspA family protein
MYRDILVPIDGSATATRGLAEAIALAKEQPTTLHLVHVLDDYPLLMDNPPSPQAWERDKARLREVGSNVLSQGEQLVRQSGVACTTHLREATAVPVADAIVEEARERRCGLIVMGTHGRKGVNRLVMGSEADGVVRNSPVPVLLVRRTPEPRVA